MGFFQITSHELRSKAETLKTLNAQLGAKGEELSEQEGGLCSMWEGQAKELFHQAFIRDREQMEAFIGLIERYIQAMLEIAARYEEAEARNAELAASRKY